jgi:L-glyceraldehyde 3-phosphate reductase
MDYIADENRYGRMRYNRCGQRGLKLPAVSLGLWHNFGQTASLENARAMLRCAFDLGITHFDLANNYGPPPGSAEETCGRLLKQDFSRYRDELIISSKAGYDMWAGPYGDWGSRKYLVASCDQSLKRLGVDYVDIFYHHRPDPNTPLEETMGALDYIVRSGRALYAGISNYDGDGIRRAAAMLAGLGTPLLINQNRYNLFDRAVEHGVLHGAADTGSGLIIFSPLAQGLLTDRYLNGIPGDSRVKTDGRFLNESRISDERIAQVRQLSAMAAARGQSMAQLALAWVLRHRAVTSVLIGASQCSQIEACSAAVENIGFSTDELERIDAVLSPSIQP